MSTNQVVVARRATLLAAFVVASIFNGVFWPVDGVDFNPLPFP